MDNKPLPDRIVSRSKPKAAKAKTKAKRRPAFSGSNAPKSAYRTEPLQKPSGKLWIKAANQNVELRVELYKKDGSLDNAALAQLDDMFRCLATGEVRAMNPLVYENLSRIQDHFEGKQLEMYSAFRYTDRSSSRHFHASAADFKIPGISIYTIKKYAETLDTGHMGLGIYPSGQFLHIDVRAPGEPSFRWTDYSGSSRVKPSKARGRGRTQPARKPVS
ncbi:MAG: DUF882 domain-containing protein [Deltaproteobacteria bacterium]|nr:DUF882 domain-containing protein [Deltaproteobacteria bacterium]